MMNKALLSKLMAREDLEVIEGNFKTASFDPKNRVVRLPLLKEEFDEAATLFIGHEIGHALYTPDIFSHKDKAADIADIPFDIINIVEDVRIERKVREFYPGLVNDFLKGYKRLMTEDFFSVKDKDLNKLKFLDRLNLKAKLNSLVDIDFSLPETLMIEKVNAAQTFEDTVTVSREVMEFIKHQQEEEQEQPTEEKSSGDDKQDPEEQAQQSNKEQTSVSSEEEDSEEETNTETKGSSGDVGEDENPEDEIDYSSDTDRSMRKNESKMIHDDNTTTHIRVTKDQLHNDFIYTEKDMEDSANEAKDKYSVYRHYNDAKEEFAEEYNTFVKDVKPAVNAMVQQFELRKSAMESKKIRESTSGSIDVNKLWQYKLDDHIFKSVMSVPDSKNHGLLMYIDYSASMSRRIYETLKQSVVLSMFAKRVGIPFELYGFTTNGTKYHKIYSSDSDESNSKQYDYKDWAVKLVKIADSKWSKSKMHEMFERAMFSSYSIENRHSSYTEPAFELGGTPLSETISMAHIMADDFVKRHHTEKMNIVFLTDGDAQDMRLSEDLNNWAEAIIWDIEGHGKIELTDKPNRYVYSDQRRVQAKKTLFESLRKKYNVIGFYLTDRRNRVDKNGYAVYKNYGGYDSFIMVHDKRLQASDDEFVTAADTDANISTEVTNRRRMNSIKRDFKKFQKNKKMNKLIAQEFAKLVA